MPRRKLTFKNGGYYHVFNHNVDDKSAFKEINYKEIYLELINFYRFEKNTLSFSDFRRKESKTKKKYLSCLFDTETKVDIYAFCIMENHYHLLLKQNKDDGVKNFIRLIQNSFAKYYNIKNDRKGALFLSPFKAVEITTEEELTHVLRYIHLNPLTSFALKNINQLAKCKWTSYIDYISYNQRNFVETVLIRNLFPNVEEFKEFHTNQIDYQRRLKVT